MFRNFSHSRSISPPSFSVAHKAFLPGIKDILALLRPSAHGSSISSLLRPGPSPLLRQIRKHEWFQVHLPAYLALSPEEQQHAEETVCQDILGYVATKVRPHALVNGARMGS